MAETTMKAALLASKEEKTLSIGDAPLPSPGPGMIRIKTAATAVNPVDWKMAQQHFLISEYPVALGCDGAGVVDAVGEGVTSVKPGDEVASFPGLGKPGRGTFAEYFVTHETNVFRKPKDLSFEDMATLPVGALTAALSLYDNLKLSFPSAKKYDGQYFLVWGGSSAVGIMVVQLAAISGFKVIATASKHNFDMVRSYGATAVVDYHADNAADEIATLTEGKLNYAFDAVGGEATKIVGNILKECGGGSYVSCAGSLDTDIEGVEFQSVMLGTLPDQPGGWEKGATFYKELQGLLDAKALKPFRVKGYKGFEGVLDAMKDSSQGRVSGEKLVISLQIASAAGPRTTGVANTP